MFVTITYGIGPKSAAYAAVQRLAKSKGLHTEPTNDANRETIQVADAQALDALLADLKTIDGIQIASA